MAENRSSKIVSDKKNTFFTNNRLMAGLEIPTSGQYNQGDIIVNISGTGNSMWICTESGEPGVWNPISGTGSSGKRVVNYRANVIVNEPVMEIPITDLNTTVNNNDTLLVHFNSTYLVKDVDYEVVNNGTLIRKLDMNEPWNESSEPNSLFSIELIKIENSVDTDLMLRKSAVIVDTPVNEVSLEGLNVEVEPGDKLLVHFNSTHLLEGVDYEIINGTKIVKLTEGMWNKSSKQGCLFSLELFKNVAIDSNGEIIKGTKLVNMTNNVIVPQNVDMVNIGISDYNQDNDTLLVFKNSTFMTEGVDYNIEGEYIKNINGFWNVDGLDDYTITFVIFKDVAVLNPDTQIQTIQIKDASITLEKLSDNVKNIILNNNNMEIGDLNNLNTQSKTTIVDAINEIMVEINNLKEIINQLNANE